MYLRPSVPFPILIYKAAGKEKNSYAVNDLGGCITGMFVGWFIITDHCEARWR